MMVTWCYLSAHLSSRINLTLHRLKMNVLQPLIIRFHHVQNLRLYLPLNARFLRWGESLAAFRDGRVLHQLNTAPWRFGWQERRRNDLEKKPIEENNQQSHQRVKVDTCTLHKVIIITISRWEWNYQLLLQL